MKRPYHKKHNKKKIRAQRRDSEGVVSHSASKRGRGGKGGNRPQIYHGVKPATARQMAAFVLQQDRSKRFITDIIDSCFSEFPLRKEEDRRLAYEMITGTLRRQGTIDFLLQACCTRPVNKIEKELLCLLRLGCYQLAFLDSIPSHAAVHETVDLARWLGNPRWCSFMNGVLRSVDRLLSDEKTEAPAQDAYAVAEGLFRQTNQPVFSNPETQPLDYLSQAYSFPLWLLKRWSKKYSQTEIESLCRWFNGRGEMCLRVNSLKTSRDELIQKFEQAQPPLEVEPGASPVAIHVKNSRAVARFPGFEAGLFAVQDETPQQVGLMLAPQPGERILDFCAAPGTKTTHLAEMMNNEGEILASDVNPWRLKKVVENCERLGITIVKQQVIAHQPPYLIQGPFDAVLIDAPCSNTGVLGKRPEARWRIQSDDINELASIQSSLLHSAVSFLSPGGRILYSTCSIEAEENENQIKSFLQKYPKFELKEERSFLPGQPSDGGYAALLVDTNSSD